jgi:hypothetical protein
MFNDDVVMSTMRNELQLFQQFFLGTKKLKTFWFDGYNMRCNFHMCIFWFIVKKWPIGCALNLKNMIDILTFEDMVVEKMVDKRFFEKKSFIWMIC